MSRNLPQVDEIFDQAVRLAPGEARERFLGEVCGGDAALRQRVERLLRAVTEAGSFLESPAQAPAPTIDLPVTEMPGTQAGPYKLLQLVGEGGMGSVWMAEQHEPMRRRVALKLIKPGMDSRQVLARFEAERQALSMMDHPNIARVLDAGTMEGGRPYFVMELVKGQPITQYCDEHNLTPRERLELFLPVCHAIQHAHHKGIIHRDIKPSNVLVAEYDGWPVAKVIDFGVAKAIHQPLTEATMFTGLGQIIGTLEYMSPEQARMNQLDIDTRSDVYSLGVLLYELLTGSTPFDKCRLKNAALDELLRIIRDEVPLRPSTKLTNSEKLPSIAAKRKTEPAKLSSLVRGELDWIVMKALEKERSRRYETANGFAQDIQRYLNDEQVVACPPSMAYRFGKFARRNRAALATISVVVSALVVGTSISLYQAVRATRAEKLSSERLVSEKSARRDAVEARQEAEKARDYERQLRSEAERQRQKADDNFLRAHRAVNQYLDSVTQSELLSVAGLQSLRRELLSAALPFYTELTAEQTDDPSLHFQLAGAFLRLSRIQAELGNVAESLVCNHESISILEKLKHQQPDDLDVQKALAEGYLFDKRENDCIALCDNILKKDPKQTGVKSLLADAYNAIAVAESSAGQLARSLENHQQAFQLRESLVREFPENPDYLAQLGGTFNNLGTLLVRQQRISESREMFERAVELTTEAFEKRPQSVLWGRWLATSLHNLADTLARTGAMPESLQAFERLVIARRKLVHHNPAIASLRAELYRAYVDLAKQHQQLGNADHAILSFSRARDVLENMPRATALDLFELATVYAVLAKPAVDQIHPSETDPLTLKDNADRAVENLRAAIELGYVDVITLKNCAELESLWERDDFQALVATLEAKAKSETPSKNPGDVGLAKLKENQLSAERLKRLVVSNPDNKEHHEVLAAALYSVGVIQSDLKQFEAAENSLSEALGLRQQLAAQDQANSRYLLDVLATRFALGEVYFNEFRFPGAHREWQAVLSLLNAPALGRGADPKIRATVAELERKICDRYGELGLWSHAAEYAFRNVAGNRFSTPAHDMRFATLIFDLAGPEALRNYINSFLAARNTAATTGDSSDDVLISWAGVLLSPAPALDSLTEFAESHLNDHAHLGGDATWSAYVLALAAMRAGAPQRSLELLSEHGMGGGWLAGWEVPKNSIAAFVAAMAYQNLGRHEDAVDALHQADMVYQKFLVRTFDCVEGEFGMPNANKAWWVMVYLRSLRLEAWRIVYGQAAPYDYLEDLRLTRSWWAVGENEKAEAAFARAMQFIADVNLAFTSQPLEYSQWQLSAIQAFYLACALERAGRRPEAESMYRAGLKAEAGWMQQIYRRDLYLSALSVRLAERLRAEAEKLLQISSETASQTSQVWEWEAEELVTRCSTDMALPANQWMAQFGPYWSNNQQLFWRPFKVGGQLHIQLPEALEGRYEIKLWATEAPDYGTIELLYGSRSLGPAIDFYAKGVVGLREVTLGEFDLAGNESPLTIRVVGKHVESVNYYVGLDKLCFTRVDRAK